MKLNELNLDGYKHILKNDWNLPENLVTWLEEKDFELIGEGDLSKVFQSKNEHFVVKVNKGKVEKEYETFVNFCRRNSFDTHLPKFGQMRMIENNNIKFYVLFIEKLEIMPKNRDVNFKLCEFIDKIWTNLKKDDGLSANEVYNLVKDWDENYNNGACFKSEYVDQFLSLTKTLKNMSRFIKSPILDLHSENLGLRNNGIIVILDPVRAVEN